LGKDNLETNSNFEVETVRSTKLISAFDKKEEDR
jgi:hypothetical protein